MDKRTETHKLKCEFTQEELLKLGERNAILQQELTQIEEEKKANTAHFASQVKIKKEEINLTSTQIANKYEHRSVECEVEFHMPDKGKKKLTRTDTGESWIENMSDVDWNLWNDKIVHEECDLAFNTPNEGMKTFTHKERPELTFVENMTESDFDKLQGELFDKAEQDQDELEQPPSVEEDPVEEEETEETY